MEFQFNVEMNEEIDLDEIPAIACNSYTSPDSDPETEESPRYDPFILAAQSRNLDDFRKTIGDYLSSIDDQMEHGDTVLHYCCLFGYFYCVQQGANFMIQNKDATPLHDAWQELLHDAARGEHLEVIRLLLDAGASPKMTNNHGKITAMLVRTNLRVRSILAAAAAAKNGD